MTLPGGWLAHLKVVTDAAQERADEAASLLCYWWGRYLHQQGDYAGARPYYEQALAIDERVLGPEHPHTRVVRGNLEALGKEGEGVEVQGSRGEEEGN